MLTSDATFPDPLRRVLPFPYFWLSVNHLPVLTLVSSFQQEYPLCHGSDELATCFPGKHEENSLK